MAVDDNEAKTPRSSAERRAGWERGAVYCRTNVLGGYGLDGQLLDHLEFAEAQHIHVDPADIFVDFARGNRPDRPGFSALRARLLTGEIDVVVSAGTHVLSRDPSELIALCRDADVVHVGRR